MLLEEKLNPYIDAVRDGMNQENWILVTAGALMLPDICAALTEKSGQSSGVKYINWFDKYCHSYKFTYFEYNEPKPNNINDYNKWRKTRTRVKENGKDKMNEHLYFSGLLAYALRCAFLHNGSGQVDSQIVHKKELKSSDRNPEETRTLGANKIILDLSMESKIIGRSEDIIYLNPKSFAEEIIDGVYYWIKETQEESYVLNNAKNFIEIKVE